jgi:hypothetical protein
VKAFDKVKRKRLIEVLQSKFFKNLLLKNIVEIYSGNKIKISTQLSERHTINHRVREGCLLLPTLTNIYRKEMKVK